MGVRHFLSLLDLSPAELKALLARAIELKQLQRDGVPHAVFPNKVLGMVFEKASTRTRVSFEAGMAQFGGHAIFLSPRDTQLGRGEPIEDTAKVLSSMVDIIMLRTHAHEIAECFAAHSSVPVINGLTEFNHPCQLLADMQTYLEARGDIAGRRVAWIGDGNNMCNSYINAAAQLGFELVVAAPAGYEPDSTLVARFAHCVSVVHDPLEAARGADLITTDVWTSMGQEDEQQRRMDAFKGFIVDERLMSVAAPDAIFLHCLPAHRGEEVAAEVIDGPQSVVWQQAENRLHAQKALIEFLLCNRTPD